jgi:hypothetical protein
VNLYFVLQDYGLAELHDVGEVLLPDGMYDFHVGLFVLMHDPVSEAPHPYHPFGKRLGDHLFPGKYFEDSGLRCRRLPPRIAYDMGADVDAQLNRLDRVEKDDALQLPVGLKRPATARLKMSCRCLKSRYSIIALVVNFTLSRRFRSKRILPVLRMRCLRLGGAVLRTTMSTVRSEKRGEAW